MNLHPDFLEHWRVRRLAKLLGGQVAIVCLIHLWAHCERRSQFVFHGLTGASLKTVCHFPGDGFDLEKALEECGFVRREDVFLHVEHWADVCTPATQCSEQELLPKVEAI